MGNKELQKSSVKSARNDLSYINDTFNISATVDQLHHMMKNVTKEELNAKTVNAACNCVTQLNQTINTTINAAKYLSQFKNEDEGED